MSNFSHLPYRPCVGIALFNAQGQVFVGERIDTPGAWQMPQGGVDAGEDIVKAALRELAEEAGIHSAELIRTADKTLKYDLPDHLLGIGEGSRLLWGGRYRGQEQSWVALRFTGDECEINLSPGQEPPEFSRWQWVDLDQTLDLIVPFKRDTYRQVIAFFKDIP